MCLRYQSRGLGDSCESTLREVLGVKAETKGTKTVSDRGIKFCSGRDTVVRRWDFEEHFERFRYIVDNYKSVEKESLESACQSSVRSVASSYCDRIIYPAQRFWFSARRPNRKRQLSARHFCPQHRCRKTRSHANERASVARVGFHPSLHSSSYLCEYKIFIEECVFMGQTISHLQPPSKSWVFRTDGSNIKNITPENK